MFAHGRDGYSRGVIFHVNRGWQGIAILLFVKLAAAHMYTRTAQTEDVVIKCQPEARFYTKLLRYEGVNI